MLAPAPHPSPPRVLPDPPDLSHPTAHPAHPLPPLLHLARLTRWLAPLELGLGVVITLASVYLHALQSQVAGGLWRDEVVSVRVANMPTLGQTWRYLEFDSYPILYHLLLRGWCGLFTAGDTSLRTLGLFIGLSVVAVFWRAGRTLGIRVPLLALGLLALNPIMIRYGDSMRAYGLGCTLAIVSLAAVWRVAQARAINRRHLLWAMAAALISVQCLYHNAALLLAGCLAGALVALWNRRVPVAAATLAIGLPAAISLLPYLPIIHRTRRWSFLMYFPITPQWLWSRLAMVTGSPLSLGVWLWTTLFAGSVGLTGWWLFAGKKRGAASPPGTDGRVFAGLTLTVATVLYGGFLYSVGYITQPWYYLSLLAFVAICLDAVYGQAAARHGWRWFRVGVAAAFSLLAVRSSFAALQMRATNIDIIAANLNANVRPTDLVLVNRWECAISLQRYYHGPARLLSVPDLADHNVHRYDLIIDKMMAPDPLRPVFDAMHRTLQSGGRVWMVGACFLAEPGESYAPLPPATIDSKGKWRSGKMIEHWALEVNEDLFHHCTDGAAVSVEPLLAVSEFEDVPLHWFSGWQAAEDPAAPPGNGNPR